MKRLFKGGTVVSSEGMQDVDILVKGEKILAVGRDLAFRDAEIIDVKGKLLFPGFIDAHTHMALEVSNTVTADDFYSGTGLSWREELPALSTLPLSMKESRWLRL